MNSYFEIKKKKKTIVSVSDFERHQFLKFSTESLTEAVLTLKFSLQVRFLGLMHLCLLPGYSIHSRDGGLCS